MLIRRHPHFEAVATMGERFPTYGYRKIHALLRREDLPVSDKACRAILRITRGD